MQKTIAAIIICVLVHAQNSFGMLLTRQSTQQSTRTFYRLKKKNLFNSTDNEIANNTSALFDDLHERNAALRLMAMEQIANNSQLLHRLLEQDAIITAYQKHNKSFDIQTLDIQETEIRERMRNNLAFSKDMMLANVPVE